MPYAWQPIGDYIKVPTSSHSRRLNILGFLKRDNGIVPYMIEGSVDAKAIIESFDQFSEKLEKRSYVLIDNAPMHGCDRSPSGVSCCHWEFNSLRHTNRFDVFSVRI